MYVVMFLVFVSMFHAVMRSFGQFWCADFSSFFGSGCRSTQRPPEDAGHPKTHTVGMLEILSMSPAGSRLSSLDHRLDHRNFIRYPASQYMLTPTDGKRAAGENHCISFRVSSPSHFHSRPESAECVLREMVSSRIGLHGFIHRPMASLTGKKSIIVFFGGAHASSLTAHDAGAGPNDFGVTRGKLAQTEYSPLPKVGYKVGLPPYIQSSGGFIEKAGSSF